MFLQISHAGESLAEVYSILESKNSAERRYGVFLFPGRLREQEEYVVSVDQAVDLLLSACENKIAGDADVVIPA